MAFEHRELPVSRRHFVRGAGALGLGLLAGCGRRPGQVQAPARTPRVGWITGVSAASGQADIFREALHELGWVEGQNIMLEFRFAEGRPERFPEFATELVRLPADVLVTVGSSATQAAKDVTNTVPIVTVNSQDPVRDGFIASLARPGGNITGLTGLMTGLSEKRWDLLRGLIPGVSRVAVLTNRNVSVAAMLAPHLAEIEAAGRPFGLQFVRLELQTADDFETAFETAVQERVDTIMIQTDALTINNRVRIAGLAMADRLPMISDRREYVEVGSLLSYGPNVTSQYRRAAYYVDRILRGTKPAELPVEQPTTFEFVINLKTAQALGLTIPPHVLLQATEVIQ
jgi:putative ABC transport system substrate-binding protein